MAIQLLEKLFRDSTHSVVIERLCLEANKIAFSSVFLVLKMTCFQTITTDVGYCTKTK